MISICDYIKAIQITYWNSSNPLLLYKSYKSYKSLSKEDIRKINRKDTEKPCITKMFLYAYYDYMDEIKKYSNKKLKRYMNFYKYSLVHLFTSRGNIEGIKYLYSRGINIDSKDKYGNTLFLLACINKNVDMIEYLYSKGVDINCKDNNGYNAFLIACINNNVEMMKYLYSIGVDINCKDVSGNNAYLIAASHHNLQLLKYLEEIGIDTEVKNNNGSSAYDLAYKHEIKQYLLLKHKRNIMYEKYKCDPDECLICCVTDDDKYITCKNNHIYHLDCIVQYGKLSYPYCFTNFV